MLISNQKAQVYMHTDLAQVYLMQSNISWPSNMVLFPQLQHPSHMENPQTRPSQGQETLKQENGVKGR